MHDRLFIGLRWALIAGVAGSGAVALGVVGSPLHWSFDLLAQFLLPAAIVALLIVPVAALARWPRIAGAAAVVALLSYGLASSSTSAPSPVSERSPRFKVLLFNIWYGNRRLDDVAQMIVEKNADLVVIIEAPKRVRDGLRNVESLYPYHFDCADADCDALIFSRGRLLPVAIAKTQDQDRSPYVTIATELGGCRMSLVALHLTRPFPNRPFSGQRAQAREIGGAVGALPGAKLVLGDFNAAPWGYVIRTIEERGRVRALTGAGGTWPTVLPQQLRIPIDHMLAGPGLSFVSREVLPRIGSDHAPVLAEVAVTDPTQCR